MLSGSSEQAREQGEMRDRHFLHIHGVCLVVGTQTRPVSTPPAFLPTSHVEAARGGMGRIAGVTTHASEP